MLHAALPASIVALLGRRVTRPILRLAPAGAYVAVDANATGALAEALLVPGRELPAGAVLGTNLDVFVHLDPEQRPIATTRHPHLTLGEVAFLEVTAVTQIGAFVDWGLGKELLVPFAEQSYPLAVGERHPIGLYLDKSQRLAGTTNVRPLLQAAPNAPLGAWLEGVAWRNEPGIGLFVIIDRRSVGVVPTSEPHTARRGDVVRCRVAEIMPDGKRVLSLRDLAHLEAAADAARILAVLDGPRPPRLTERASPEQLRSQFGLSKKAFKRAVGRLLREGAIDVSPDGSLRRLRPRA